MSMKWPGGLIRKTPVTPAGPLQNGAAPGMWTMAEAAYWTKQGLWPIAGNFLAVEDVFSTYLFTGVTSGSSPSQTITNGIDLSGNGGLVWHKARSAQNHFLMDTVTNQYLNSNTTNAGTSITGTSVFTPLSNGYTTNIATSSGINYASWTFREAANFFDVVTYTGTAVGGVGTQTITHQLGSAPGTIIVKRTDSTSNWFVYHRSLGASKSLFMNTTGSENFSDDWNYVTPSATSFNVGPAINVSGGTYVAYLFAHDTSSTGLIQCGSYTGTNAAGNLQNLGWEPQWVLVKRASGAEGWLLSDNMRGVATGGVDAILQPNSSAAEFSTVDYINYRAKGFDFSGADGNESGQTYIYIAIRRAPMRTPTVGTSVFSPYAAAAPGNAVVTTSFPVDLQIQKNAGAATDTRFVDRLRGINTVTTETVNVPFLVPSDTTAEATGTTIGYNWNNTGFTVGTTYSTSAKAWALNFRRAPSFFDEVCYTGTSATNVISHNLGAAPELAIFKQRSASGPWRTFVDFGATTCKYVALNATNASSTVTYSSSSSVLAQPTATNITIGTLSDMNGSGNTYVAYLFASCPGVSKVGSYTGTGTTQTINCGFTTGARFVLIKRTDSTGDWYVWDSARGIVAGNDPYLLLNSTAAEVTSTDYIDTDNSGFQISSTAPAAINANGGTFIYLAIS